MSDVPIRWMPEGEYILDEDKRTVREDGEQWCRADLPPGSAEWSRNRQDEVVGLLFVCPCGCGSVGDLSIVSGYGGHVWQMTGTYDSPTLRPSIQKTSPCRWHGWLTDGVFKVVP